MVKRRGGREHKGRKKGEGQEEGAGGGSKEKKWTGEEGRRKIGK